MVQKVLYNSEEELHYSHILLFEQQIVNEFDKNNFRM